MYFQRSPLIVKVAKNSILTWMLLCRKELDFDVAKIDLTFDFPFVKRMTLDSAYHLMIRYLIAVRFMIVSFQCVAEARNDLFAFHVMRFMIEVIQQGYMGEVAAAAVVVVIANSTTDVVGGGDFFANSLLLSVSSLLLVLETNERMKLND